MIEELGFQHIKSAVRTAVRTVDDYRKGNKTVLCTNWPRLNRQLLGGLQPKKLYVIAGRPGSGKSFFANNMLFDILSCNHDKKIIVLYWNFEMSAWQQILRAATGDSGIGYSEALSVEESLADSKFFHLIKKMKNYENFPVYFCDIPKSLNDFGVTVSKVCESNPDSIILNIIDHSRLYKPGKERSELDRLNYLSSILMRLQARYNVINVLLSQLNREIEKPDRARQLFKPMLSDLFGADSIGQAAHAVMMINRPHAMYNIEEPYLGYDPKNKLFLHIEKNRDGEMGCIPYETKFPSFKIVELLK